MVEKFTVTLSSDTKCVFREQNKVGNFRVHMGHTIQLQGHWSVALHEIYYPETFRNIREEDAIVRLYTSEGVQNFFLESKYYYNNAQLVDEINAVMDGCFRIVLDENSIVTIHFDENSGFNSYDLSETLLNILGLRQNHSLLNNKREIKGDYPCDVRRGFAKSFYLLTDIVKDQCHNNTQLKCLRKFDTSSKNVCYGFHRHKSFEKLLYIPLSKSNMEYVDFNIRDEYLRETTFDRGTLTVVLVFKRNGYEC
jgi:hypothetical protein